MAFITSTRGGAGSSTVTGPGSSTDNAIARFDGTGGTTIQNSGILISDTNQLIAPVGSRAAPSITFTGHLGAGMFWNTTTAQTITGEEALEFGTNGAAGAFQVAGSGYGGIGALLQFTNNSLIGGDCIFRASAVQYGGLIFSNTFGPDHSWAMITSKLGNDHLSFCYSNTAAETMAGLDTAANLKLNLNDTGSMVLMSSTGAHILWNTDGAGSVGDSACANRPLDVRASNKLQVGGTADVTSGTVGSATFVGNDTNGVGLRIYAFADSGVFNSSASLTFGKGRGTQASPTPLLTGDSVGLIKFRGTKANGALPSDSAYIQVLAEENFSNSTTASHMDFSTTPVASIVPVVGMSLKNNGALVVTGDVSAPTVTPANGASGTFTTVDLKTVTVLNGIITSIV